MNPKLETSKTCPPAVELDRLVHGRLTEARAAAIAEHVGACSSCQKRLDALSGGTEELKARYVFVFIGAQPRTEWLKGTVALDAQGFVLTGPDLTAEQLAGWPLPRPPYLLEASVPGVFAAGDVRHESVKRVASAVGEGSVAVHFMHRYRASL